MKIFSFSIEPRGFEKHAFGDVNVQADVFDVPFAKAFFMGLCTSRY